MRKISCFWLLVSNSWFLVFGFWFLVSAPWTHAQTLSLGLYPPLLEVMIKPGKSITQVFTLSNFGDPLILTSGILPFTPKDEFGNIHLQPPTPPPPALSWFSFQNADLSLGESFVLNGGQTQQIVLKIKIPKNAPEGDYYLSLVFSSKPKEKRFFGPQSKAKIAANILLTVSESGRPQKSAQIVKLWVPKIVDSFDRVPVVLKLKNTGRAFFKPKGKIILKAPFGLKTSFPLLPENVLAGSTRLLQASPSSALTTPRGGQQPATLFLSGFFLGPYQVLAQISSLDQTPVSLSQKEIFWAFPFKLTLALGVAIIFLFLVRRKAEAK